MRMKRVIIVFIVVASLAVFLYLIDTASNTPPTVGAVNTLFVKERDAIDAVVNQMAHMGFCDIYIPRNDGQMLADLSMLEIQEETFLLAIDRLLGSGSYLQMGKEGNTVWLLQWTGVRDIGCGIAYSIDGITPPYIEYCTELIPISADGWYYYVSDYNLWRSSRGTSVLNPA